MAGRIVAPYERVLSTTVNDIEHIESQSLPGVGVVKIYFQPNVEHQRCAGAGHLDIADDPQAASAGRRRRRIILVYNASSVRSSSSRCRATRSPRSSSSTSPRTSSAPSSPPSPGRNPFALWRRDAPGSDRSRSEGAARLWSFRRMTSAMRSPGRTRSRRSGTEKIGSYEFTVDLNDSPKAHRRLQQHADQGGQRRRRLHARRRLRPRRIAAADQRRPARRHARAC